MRLLFAKNILTGDKHRFTLPVYDGFKVVNEIFLTMNHKREVEFVSYSEDQMLNPNDKKVYLFHEFLTVDYYKNEDIVLCALAVSEKVYDNVHCYRNISDRPGHLLDREYRFSLKLEDFAFIGFITLEREKSFQINLKNKKLESRISEVHLVLNQLRKTDELTTELISQYKSTVAPFKLDTNFKSTYFQHNLLDLFRQIEEEFFCFHYFEMGMAHNDYKNNKYDPDLAFQYFEKCGNFLPALKEILPFYILASIDDEGQIENPYAYALAEQTAATIIALEPDHSEAKNFLARENRYGKSITIKEKFNHIVSQPMLSTTFFTDFKKVQQRALFDRKNERNDKYANDRSEAQHEWDKNYGLILR